MAGPVAQKFSETAKRIRAIVVVDIPDSDGHGDALAEAESFDIAPSRLLYPVYGRVLFMDGKDLKSLPSSPVVAATIARHDRERKWSHSPSNMPIDSIVGVSSPLSFSLTDPYAESNILNSKGISCIINYNGQFKLWGNHGLGIKGDDKRWQFINIVRTYDIMLDSLERAHMWAMDRGITVTYMEDVANSQNVFYSSLVRDGHLLKGKCIPDSERTTPDQIAEGNVFWNIEWCGVYPANTLNFKVRMDTASLKDLFNGSA